MVFMAQRYKLPNVQEKSSLGNGVPQIRRIMYRMEDGVRIKKPEAEWTWYRDEDKDFFARDAEPQLGV